VDADENAEHDRLYAAALPVLDAAFRAAARSDTQGVDQALHRGLELGVGVAFYAFGMLAAVAVKGVKLPPGADGFMPVVVRGGKPVDPDAPENAALAFVGRFLAAAHEKDEDQARALWVALLEPACGREPVPGARQTFGEAWRLLVVAAIEGRQREKRRQERTHQHPKASRTNGTRRRHLRRR
jgi:hypothetical protein